MSVVLKFQISRFTKILIYNTEIFMTSIDLLNQENDEIILQAAIFISPLYESHIIWLKS